MPCFMSIAFNNSFSPRKRAISSSCFFFSSATRQSLVCDAFSMLLIHLIIILFSLNYSVRSSKWFNISLIHINSFRYYLALCFSWSIWTYSQAFDRIPPFDWLSIAAILKRPLAPISAIPPSAGIILPNFIIQWLILSLRLPIQLHKKDFLISLHCNLNFLFMTYVQLHYVLLFVDHLVFHHVFWNYSTDHLSIRIKNV